MATKSWDPKGDVDRHALDQVTDTLMAGVGAEAIVPFGSRVWGDEHHDGDHDLSLVMPDATRPASLRLHEVNRLVADVGLPLDLVAMTVSRDFEGAGEIDGLARQVRTDGVVVAGAIPERVVA